MCVVILGMRKFSLLFDIGILSINSGKVNPLKARDLLFINSKEF
jgi:hypothetical protein